MTSRVMKMRLKVFPGMHLAHCLPPVGETNLFGYGKFYQLMSSSVWLSCKDIHKMLKWSSGILIWTFCSHVAMITPLRYLYIKRKKFAIYRETSVVISVNILLKKQYKWWFYFHLIFVFYGSITCIKLFQVWAEDGDDDWTCVQTITEANKYYL